MRKVFFAVTDLLRRPAYAIPLVMNVTGSVWFFLLIGKAELSLTVPITNSLAFCFTVLGEWITEGKAVTRGMHVLPNALETDTDHGEADTWIGMTFVLAGIALCVHSKS